MPITINDIHSQLNQTTVDRVVKPKSLVEIQSLVEEAKVNKQSISIAGGRHAMGGQQFASGSLHLDMTELDKILEIDPKRGLLHCEAGIMWPKIIDITQSMASPHKLGWGIRQKQTGVDDVTLGGSIAANAHGRGLGLCPMADDIEEITLVNSSAEVVVCSRNQNKELFSLVIGGYGLFGVIYSTKLRLIPRQKVKRIVNVIDIQDAENAIYRRIDEGCIYGDFQYAVDPSGEEFMSRGVFACYKPVDDEMAIDDDQSDLPPEAWLTLIKLAHEDKKAAYKLYAQHYIGTDGQIYWSDTMQLSTYIPTYSEFLEKNSPETHNGKESLMIGEHYVPYDKVREFMDDAKAILQESGTEVIYGTIRAINQDTVTFLPWAKQDYGCIIFNLRTHHSEAGLKKVESTFQQLIDSSLSYGGSFFLTYHHYATPEQVKKAYPQIREFFALKQQYDPEELFQSEWYRHYRSAFTS